jgi:hypothetical protein
LRSFSLVGVLAFLALCCTPAVSSAREHLQVFVTEPYLELHTGAGRGYPVFNVVPRDQSVWVLFRRTDWFKVRTEKGVEGWASQRDMLKTELADGTPFIFDLGDRSGFTSHHFEAGAFLGVWGGANYVSAFGSYSFNSQLALEASVGNFFGKYYDGVTGDLGLSHVVMPEWRISPFFTIGTGLVHFEPKVSLVQPSDHVEQTAYVGAGLRCYLTRRFFIRAEFKEHYLFTNLNQNQRAAEWKMGFAFFF